ncbi:phosphotransferase enzyme family protein [Streptomyces sp. NPDC102381]|uniref:phosphotransferase enzyme family protein n=1 Tax=Streptomyces sp. NPDC102381 TaxID=3366164 RepID=UPI0038140763
MHPGRAQAGGCEAGFVVEGTPSRDASPEAVSGVLAERYDLDVASLQTVAAGTDTVNRIARLTDGQRVFIKQYRSATDPERAWAAWEMSEYCARQGLPVPRVVLNSDQVLVTIAAGAAWVVTEMVDGSIAEHAMTPQTAEHIGTVLGRMHRILGQYPPPARMRHTRWRTGDVDTMLRKIDRVRQRATAQLEPRLEQLREDLDQRRQDVILHVPRLRQTLPQGLFVQAAHADFTRANLLLADDQVTAVIDFQAEQAVLAWELGRIAFDPRTVAHGLQWVQCALRMIEAYRSENPRLPDADVRACARVALLYMLMSLYGSTTREYQLPAPVAEDLCRYWDDRQVTIRRMLAQLPEIETALRATGRSGQASRP